MRELLARNVNVTVSDAFGQTALMKAVEFGDVGPVQLLLKHGADVHQDCRNGNTPLDGNKANKRVTQLLANHAQSLDELLQSEIVAQVCVCACIVYLCVSVQASGVCVCVCVFVCGGMSL